MISNCIITNNTAGANGVGGAIAAGGGAQTTCRNCVIANNTCGHPHSGGISGRSGTGTHTIQNCTFYNNVAGGTYVSYGGEPASGDSIINSIFWQGACANNGTQTYTLNAGAAGAGNLTGDPLLVTYKGWPSFPAAGSPCIDAGTRRVRRCGARQRTLSKNEVHPLCCLLFISSCVFL